MSKIKTRNVVKGTIKTLDKGVVVMQKTKSYITSIKTKSEEVVQTKEQNSTEYATNQINKGTKDVVKSTKSIGSKGYQNIKKLNSNINSKHPSKIKNIKKIPTEKNKIRLVGSKIKTSENTIKNTTEKSVKASEKAIQVARHTAEKTTEIIESARKATVSSIKAIIETAKGLISALIAGGSVVVIVVVFICLIGLLCGSIYGIFFSGEGNGKYNMRDIIKECNQEFSNRLQSIQDTTPHDEYKLEGNMTTWKDVLIIYTIKVSNGRNEQEVITMNENKKQSLKDIFWTMNEITSEVKTETVVERGTTIDEMPREVQKRVLHINILGKSAEQMKMQSYFTPQQLEQYNELIKKDYDSLWNGIVYGIDSGEYMQWRQTDEKWANVRIGSTMATIKDIGCLVTSIAILAEKSGIDTGDVTPFNPGTFVEALNKVGGFDNRGALQYASINKVLPNFNYMGNVDLRNKTKKEKLDLIKQYYNQGYYLTVEVRGATPSNEHWVAIIDIDNNSIKMADPESDYNDIWSVYEWSKTSQFNYFKAN